MAILYCLDICLVRRPFYIILSFSSDLWSGIFFFTLFSSELWPGTFFSFVFFRSLIGNFFLFCFLPIFDQELSFSFFVFFQGRGWKFSSRVKVYGVLGFWLKACRTAGHDICQGVGLASGSGIKEYPTLFPWHACNNDDSEILCKTCHACTYVDTQASSFVVMWH